MKINIGCGRDYREGWVNIDISPEVKAEAHIDIRTSTLKRDDNISWDTFIKDEEADTIYISGVLEQIESNDDFIYVLNECWRVLKVGGKIEIVVPNAKYAIAHRDPMDIRKFTPDTFRYFQADTQEYRDYGSVYGFKPWRSVDIQENQRHIMTVTMTK